MTVRTDLLLDTIAFLRANPEKYNQEHYYSIDNQGCVIGWTAIRAGGNLKTAYDWPEGNRNAGAFARNFLGLSGNDFDYISASHRSLDEIEARVNEIAAREMPVATPENVNIVVNDKKFTLAPDQVDAFVLGARAVDPNVRIVKVVIAEVEL